MAEPRIKFTVTYKMTYNRVDVSLQLCGMYIYCPLCGFPIYATMYDAPPKFFTKHHRMTDSLDPVMGHEIVVCKHPA